MAPDGTAPSAALPLAPAASAPERDPISPPPLSRIVRQVRGIDAWIAARREREQALHAPGLNREEKLDVAREVEMLRRIHDTIKGRCARGMDDEIMPMRRPGLTAVIAHRHEWFVNQLALRLSGRGVSVLVCTDNGAEALGVVVAEQPELVLVGDSLSMMPGRDLLAQARAYAPSALLAVQAPDQQQADALLAVADAVFLRHHPPAHIADALVALHRSRTGEPSSA